VSGIKPTCRYEFSLCLQTFDTGRLETSGGIVEVVNVQSFAGFVLHIGKLEKGHVAVGDAVTAKVRSISCCAVG
jgi:alanyl-tRNA synthetase